MAFDTNQRGYDVVSASNERISVKTITTSTHVGFNQNTFHHVDRVMILRINIDDEKGVSVDELLDASAAEARLLVLEQAGKLVYAIKRAVKEERPLEALEVSARASYSDFELVKYESGAIRILQEGAVQPVVVKETLRNIATEVGVDLFNSKGGLKDTQQLGADVIRALNAVAGRS